MLSAIASDVRFGLRLYRRSPRFYGLLLVVLVVGIASTTAMFSILETLLWRPLPFAEPDRLVMLWGRQSSAERRPISIQDYLDWRARARSMSTLALAHNWLYALASDGEVPAGVVGAQVSGDFFHMLGIEALHGRLLTPEDDRVGAEPVAVIGAELWESRFHADPAVIGRRVSLDAHPYTVVGVAPRGFDFSYPGNERSAIWTPMSVLSSFEWFASSRGVRQWYAMARLAPGVSREEAQADLAAVAASADTDSSWSSIGVELEPLHVAIVGDMDGAVWVRFGAVGMAFLVACANVSNLLLVRTESRRTELAARAALGASRGRLIQQLLTETLLLFLLAVPLSALLSRWLVQLFATFTIAPTNALSQVGLNMNTRAWAFCVLMCLGAGLVAGLVPALGVSRIDLVSTLKNGGGSRSDGARAGIRAALVVAQVALAFALLTGGGLALMRVAELLRTPLGYEPTGVVDLRLVGVPERYDSAERRIDLLERVMAEISRLPHVVAVGSNETVPLTGYDGIMEVRVEGQRRDAPPVLVARNAVSLGYLDAMRIPLLRGRALAVTDGKDAEPVVLINQSLAEMLFPGADPIGRRILHPDVDGAARTVVGVVGNLRRDGPSGPYTLDTYSPLAQTAGNGSVLVIRTDDPEAVRRELPRVVASVEPSVGTWSKTLHRRVRDAAGDSIRISILLGGFAAIALLLSALGLYAMVSYATLLETRELGIRSALGSPPRAVLWLVMRSGLGWLAIGSGLGLVAALLLGQTLAARMPGAQSFDLRVYVLVGVSLLGAGSLAAFLPAWRAVRASPALALRYE